MQRTWWVRGAGAGVVAAAAIAIGLQGSTAAPGDAATTTPIKHVVVIFGENISFDHYFGTYPKAQNLEGEPKFTAAPGTPDVDGLTDKLLTENPNKVNPKRLGPLPASGTVTCGNNHGYTAEQNAFNGGAMDKFPMSTGGCEIGGGGPGSSTMAYFDGNTVTAYWNYAQHYAMSDRFFGTGFGPSTIGAIELVSGDTSGAVDEVGNPIAQIPGVVDNNTIYSNGNPFASFDGCSSSGSYAMKGKNIGDLLSAKGVSWGWFQTGFKPTSRNNGDPVCAATHKNVAGADQTDYDPHHNPFSYYKTTSNPAHSPPTDGVAIGDEDPAGANHNYDTSDFDAALAAGSLPAVSFLKAGHYQDGHSGNSDPIDEQHFIVGKVNAIMSSPAWKDTAIILAYDDSDGWYDHFSSPIVRTSESPEDTYSGAGKCGVKDAPGTTVATNRCGFGPRLPFVLISPYAKQNFVDHSVIDQTSIMRFIEDNWDLGRVGGGSVDKDAGVITPMFDFDGADRAAATLLNDDGTVVPPGGTPTATPVSTGTPAPTPSATPTPLGSPPRLGRLTCKASAHRHKLKVACTVKKAPRVATKLKFSLTRKGKALAADRAAVKGRKAEATFKLGKRPKRGRYVLKVTVLQPGKKTKQRVKVRL